jgi:hypothetical protein
MKRTTIATLLAGLAVACLFPQLSAAQAAGVSQRPPGGGGRPSGPLVSEGCAVEGRVVKGASEEPLAKAYVSLQREGGRFAAVMQRTGADGRFSFRDLPSGRFTLRVERQGYTIAQPGQVVRAPAYALAPGQKLTDVVVKLAAAGVVTGRVVDEDSEAMQGARVTVLRRSYERGFASFNPVGTATTNDLGEFRVAGIAAGRYFLSVNPPNRRLPTFQGGVVVGPSLPLSERELAPLYSPAFYPGVTEPSQAVSFRVAEGEEVRLGELQLGLTRGYRVRARLAGAQVGPDAARWRQEFTGVLLTPRPPRIEEPRMGRVAAGQDQVEFVDVPPGSYILSLAFQAGEDTYSARELVEVRGSDVEGIVLMVTRNVSVRGRVRVEGGEEAPPAGMVVGLVPDDRIGLGSSASVNLDGTFEIGDARPDLYRAQLRGLPPDYFLKSVKLGSEEGLQHGIYLRSGGVAQVEITVSPKGARVEGTVLGEDGKPAAGALIVLVPEPERRKMWHLFKSEISEADGTFAVRGIAPGKYRVFAWKDADLGAWMDPAFLALNESQGREVRVEEGGVERVELKLETPRPQ